MGRDRCVLSWAMFGISMACFTAVFPYTLAWNEPGAAIQACLCALLLLYSALSSLFSARGMAVPGGRKMSIFSLLFAIMLFGCVISKAGDVLLSAAAFLLSAVLSLALDYLAERPSYPRTPIPEMASAIFVLLIAAVIVAIFYILAIRPRAGEGESALQSIEINQSDEVLEDDDVEEIVINELPEAIPLHDEPSDDRFSTQEDTSMTSMQDAAADTAEAPAVPPAPTMLGAVITRLDTEADVPSAPSFIGSVISDLEVDAEVTVPVVAEEDGSADQLYDDFWIPAPPMEADDSAEEEDPWADFYIEGETVLELADGVYYMDLYVNESYVGMIDVYMEAGNPYILASAFKEYVQYSITKEALDRIFFDPPEYIGMDYLASYGVDGSFDPVQYRIDVRFSTVDMPIQLLSINSSAGRIQTRPIAGAINLEPAIFSWMATHSLSVRVYDFLDKAFWNDIDFSFSSRNQMRLFDVFLDFNYYLDWTIHDFDFDFGSYKFYVDFPDEMIRLSWGNVDTNLLSAKGTDVGIRFDKSISYAPDGYRKGSSFEQLVEVETRSEVIIYNNGDGRTENEIFHRTLDPGVYRLMDFILYSGANTILIRIEPLDGSPVKESVIELQYSASLLQPGEIYYGASLTTGRIETSASAEKDSNVVSLPLWGGRRLDYDWRNLTLSAYLRAGLANNLSGDFSFAIQNIPTAESPLAINAQVSMELTHLNSIGTTRYIANVYEYADEFGRFTAPYFNVRIGHQATTGWKPISSITASISYDSPTDFSLGTNHDVSLSLGLSGSIGIFSWGLSGSVSTDVTDFSELYGSGVLTGSFYFSPNVSLTASVNIAGYADGSAPAVGGRVGLNLRFGRHTVNASASDSYASVSYDYYDDRNSVTARIDTSQYGNIHSYGTSASYSYSGDYVNVGANISADGFVDGVGASVRLSTSTILADGLFAMASSIPSNFLLVNQQGSLRGNRISIGAANSADAVAVPMFGNTGFYSGLSSSNPGSLMIYSEGVGPIGSVYSEAVNLMRSKGKGYVLWIDREELYSVAGDVILPDGTPWINGSSPLYEATIDEEGNITLENTDNYIFTDSDGVFIATDLHAGTYAFDTDCGGEWILYAFEVDGNGQRPSDVLVFDSSAEADLEAGDTYSAVYMFDEGEVMTGDAFFAVLYPQEAI